MANTLLKQVKLPKKAKGGKKHRKWGRNLVKCAKYRASGKLRNRKLRNLVRYCKLTYEQAAIRWD